MTSGAFYPLIGIPGWLSWIPVINPEYCSGILRRAIRTCFAGKERPDWLPEQLTADEKHAVEEEKM